MIVFVLLLIVQGMNAMDISMIRYNPTDEQCLRVARYITLTQNKINTDEHQRRAVFLKQEHSCVQKVNKYLQTIDEDMNKAVVFLWNIPTIKMCDFLSEINKSDANVFHVARLLSQSNMIVFASYNKDIFTALYNNYLPEQYEDRGGFFDPANQKGVQEKKCDMDAFLGRALKKEEIPKISRQEMIQKLQEMDFIKALSVFRYITQDGITLSSHLDDLFIESSIKPFGTVYTKEMQYYFSHEDLENMTADQEQLFRDIVVQSNKGVGNDCNIDNRFMIKDGHIPLLKPHKTFILKNELFSSAQIRVDIAEPTAFEKRKDLLLFCVPHLLVMIIPDIVYSQINGAWQSAAGIIGCIVASGIFGGPGYRLIDSYNSNVPKLVSWFGVGNHKTMHRGGIFMWISILHSACAIVTQKFLSLHVLPCTIVAGALSLLRAWRVVADLKNMENVQNKRSFKRASKEGLPFTLKDLVNGPKFEQ